MEERTHRPCIQAHAILDKKASLKEELLSIDYAAASLIYRHYNCCLEHRIACAPTRYYTVLRLSPSGTSIEDEAYERKVILKEEIFSLNAWGFVNR